MNIYLDESGDLAFGSLSSKKFIIAILTAEKSKKISNIVRKFHGNIIKAGWPQQIEIKASTLYHAYDNRLVPWSFEHKKTASQLITKILQHLIRQDIYIDTIIVNKENVYPELKLAPYGILYSYYASQILIPRVIQYKNTNIFVDKRNKETHQLLTFDGYIKTCIYTEAAKAKQPIDTLNIEHVFSHEQRGIAAVDYLVWSINRYYEHGDYRFYKLIKEKISNKQCWYFSPKKEE